MNSNTYIEWPLGEDYDCETCGYTDNAVTFSQYGDLSWSVTSRLGCYGGLSAYTFEELAPVLADLKRFNVWKEQHEVELLSAVRGAIAKKIFAEGIEVEDEE